MSLDLLAWRGVEARHANHLKPPFYEKTPASRIDTPSKYYCRSSIAHLAFGRCRTR